MISRVPVRLFQVGPNVTVPWLARMIVLQSLTYGTIGLGELLRAGRLVDARSAPRRERPRPRAGRTWGSARWATANAVACGGWQWTTALHVGPVLVDRQVQQDFAGALARAGELLAVVVDLADVLGLHEALGHHRRRAEDFLVVEPDGDVAVVGGGEALGVNAPADLADLFFEFVFVHCFCSIPMIHKSDLVTLSRPQASERT